MHVCYVADARSPIAKSWISHFVAKKYQVTVINSYPGVSGEIPGARMIEFPFALSSLARVSKSSHPNDGELTWLGKSAAAIRSGRFYGAVDNLRAWAAPMAVRARTEKLATLIGDLRPDLVHAMRLPYEGFITASAIRAAPLVLSI